MLTTEAHMQAREKMKVGALRQCAVASRAFRLSARDARIGRSFENYRGAVLHAAEVGAAMGPQLAVFPGVSRTTAGCLIGLGGVVPTLVVAGVIGARPEGLLWASNEMLCAVATMLFTHVFAGRLVDIAREKCSPVQMLGIWMGVGLGSAVCGAVAWIGTSLIGVQDAAALVTTGVCVAAVAAFSCVLVYQHVQVANHLVSRNSRASNRRQACARAKYLGEDYEDLRAGRAFRDHATADERVSREIEANLNGESAVDAVATAGKEGQSGTG